MRRIKMAIVALASVLVWSQVLADYDEKAEAQAAAERARNAAAERQRQTDMQSRKDAARVQAARAALGKEAVGKSDAEALRIYDSKIKRDQATAQKAVAEAPQVAARMHKADTDTHAQRDALMQQNYGKSIKQLEGMLDAELDQFARELEKKQGR